MSPKERKLTKALIWAAEDNDLHAVKQAVEAGATINVLETALSSLWSFPGGGAAIHWAVLNGNAEVLQYLLGQGADVECLTASKKTPLLVATRALEVEACRILLEAGANPNAVGDVGETPLHVLTWELDESRVSTTCRQAVDGWMLSDEMRSVEQIAALLYQYGARDDLRTHAGYAVTDSTCAPITELIDAVKKAVASQAGGIARTAQRPLGLSL